MHPATVSAILQLDYPDRLPAGPTHDRSSVLFVWSRKGQPLVCIWLLRLELYC